MADKALFADTHAELGGTVQSAEETAPVFFEQQRHSGWQLIALIVFLLAGLSWRVLDQHVLNPVASPIGLMPYLAFVVLLSGALVYLLKVRIVVHATEEQICVSRYPWARKPLCIKWSDVDFCEITRTPLLAQWSGSNILMKHEKVFSTSGKNGLHLTTRDGENVFIGSRRLEELEQFVKRVI